MTITYCRNDPVSGRWSGVNRLLTEFEVDFNFYQHETRIATLEANYSLTVSIGTITMPTVDTMLITMTDTTTQGPFKLPTATFVDRGTWAPSTAYAVNDTFSINGTLYLVLFAHTSSASSFSAGANDGAGHNYYSAMLSLPGASLPTGGATGQMLKKSSGTDFAVTWGYPLPVGGTAHQVLLKQSSTTQDAAWATLDGAYVSFHGSTASGLTSTNVTDAIEEVKAAASSPTLSGLTDVLFGTGDPLAGAVLHYSGTKWTAAIPATAAEYQSNVSDKILTTDKVWGAAALVTLTDATTVAVDMATFINASVTLAGNRTLGNPSNTKDGQSGVIKIVQDGTGSRTLAYGANWKFAGGTAPVLTTTASAVDLLYYEVLSSTFIYATLIKDVK